MWYVPIPTQTAPQANPEYSRTANVITKLHPVSDLIKFLHAAAFSPAKSTWIAAVEKGFFSTWPGLTKTAINRFLPPSIHTAMGHLDQERKNLRSTKPTPPPEERLRQFHLQTAPMMYSHTFNKIIFILIKLVNFQYSLPVVIIIL